MQTVSLDRSKLLGFDQLDPRADGRFAPGPRLGGKVGVKPSVTALETDRSHDASAARAR
jgi:hypothetical protein